MISHLRILLPAFLAWRHFSYADRKVHCWERSFCLVTSACAASRALALGRELVLTQHVCGRHARTHILSRSGKEVLLPCGGQGAEVLRVSCPGLLSGLTELGPHLSPAKPALSLHYSPHEARSEDGGQSHDMFVHYGYFLTLQVLVLFSS